MTSRVHTYICTVYTVSFQTLHTKKIWENETYFYQLSESLQLLHSYGHHLIKPMLKLSSDYVVCLFQGLGANVSCTYRNHIFQKHFFKIMWKFRAALCDAQNLLTFPKIFKLSLLFQSLFSPNK